MTDIPSGAAPRLALRHFVALMCFFLSGFAGLVYEITWIRKASLVFGSSSFALSTVLAVFFGGWALGSYLFARVCRTTRRPVLWYAALEGLLGLIALATPLAFTFADRVYGLLYPQLSGPWVLLLVRFLLVSGLLLPATVLMGATLPLLCRQYVNDSGRIALGVGLLYGLNTFGATVGCVLCGFVFIPRIGVDTSIYLAAGLNLFIAVLVGVLFRHEQLPEPSAPMGAAVQITGGTSNERRQVFVYVLFFCCGFLILAYEVLWARFLTLLIFNTVYTYTVTLTVVLAGIVLGSVITRDYFDRSAHRAFLFGLLQVASGLSVLVILLLPAHLWQEVLAAAHGVYGVLPIAAVMLAPAVLSGMSYPLAIRMAVSDSRLTGFRVGRMTAVNTLGGIVGSLAAGFLALPVIGLHRSVLIGSAVSIAVGAAAWFVLDRRTRGVFKVALTACAVTVWFAYPRITGTRLPVDFLAKPGGLHDFAEGVTANLAVLKNGRILSLEIDRLPQGSSTPSQQIMAAHVPMLIHPAPEDVLVIGLGTGQTGSRFALYQPRRLDCVDIEGRLFELMCRNFGCAWTQDERVRFIEEDGRNFVAHTDRTYDVIGIEVGQTFRPGISAFYTREFYAEIRERLNAAGIVVQFIPIEFLNFEDFRGIVRTFTEVFPQSMLWYNTCELLMIGTVADDVQIPLARYALVDARPELHADLTYSFWGGSQYALNQLDVFLGSFLTGPAGMCRLGEGASVFRDDWPILEYHTARVDYGSGNDQIVALLREVVESVRPYLIGELTEAQLHRAGEVQSYNLDDLSATRSYWRAESVVDAEEKIKLLELAAARNPRNVGVRRNLADTMLAQQKPRRAAEHASAVIALDPQDASGHFMLAQSLMMQRRVTEALRHYAHAVEAAPQVLEVRAAYGMALLGDRRYEQAAAEFDEILRLETDAQRRAWAYAMLGRTHCAQGQDAEGVRLLERAVQLCPDLPEAQENLDAARLRLKAAERSGGR